MFSFDAAADEAPAEVAAAEVTAAPGFPAAAPVPVERVLKLWRLLLVGCEGG